MIKKIENSENTITSNGIHFFVGDHVGFGINVSEHLEN